MAVRNTKLSRLLCYFPGVISYPVLRNWSSQSSTPHGGAWMSAVVSLFFIWAEKHGRSTCLFVWFRKSGSADFWDLIDHLKYSIPMQRKRFIFQTFAATQILKVSSFNRERRSPPSICRPPSLQRRGLVAAAWECEWRGRDITSASLLPLPLFSVASGEGINHGTVCFGVGNLSNRFRDQELDRKEKLKAIEDWWKEPGLVPDLPDFWYDSYSRLDFTLCGKWKEGACTFWMPTLHQGLC